jgi:FAD/FMN-containing dehydrogenase
MMANERGASITTELDAQAVQEFAAGLRGAVILPGDAEYDAARHVWNAFIDKRPALIVRCAGVADVRAAVAFARAHHLEVAVRGGGHNVAGNATVDAGMVIDLSRMKSMRVDPERRIARAEPGLTWGEFDHETQAFGLALTGGVQSTTGIAGFTLGGGFGYLARKHGLTCDNLLSADVVTADGRLLTASPKEHADLFWGLRGGGGNFGIVTSFDFRLFPLGPVLGGMLVYPAAQAEAVLRFYREFVTTAPEELFALPIFSTAPAAANLPAHLHGQHVLNMVLCYAGTPEVGARVVRPLRDFGPPEVDLVRTMPYTEVQRLLDAANPPGRLNYWKAEYFNAYSDEAIRTIVHHASQRPPSPYSKILLSHLRGAISRVGHDETAYIHRQAPFLININAMWTDLAESERQIAWARDYWAAMQPFSAGGVYVNFLSNEGEDRIKAAYDPATYARLVAVKNAYDPTNLFHLNQNIQPAPAAPAPRSRLPWARAPRG